MRETRDAARAGCPTTTTTGQLCCSPSKYQFQHDTFRILLEITSAQLKMPPSPWYLMYNHKTVFLWLSPGILEDFLSKYQQQASVPSVHKWLVAGRTWSSSLRSTWLLIKKHHCLLVWLIIVEFIFWLWRHLDPIHIIRTIRGLLCGEGMEWQYLGWWLSVWVVMIIAFFSANIPGASTTFQALCWAFGGE